MPKVEEYRAAKRALREAEQVADLIGKEYHGGGGGIGKIHSLSIAMEVYHQEYNGATNYHRAKSLDSAMSAVARAIAPKLIADAIERLKADVAILAKAAHKEQAALLAEAESL